MKVPSTTRVSRYADRIVICAASVVEAAVVVVVTVVLVMAVTAPALLGGLAGNADTVGDFGPGVAEGAQPGDGDVEGVFDLARQGEQVVEGFDVAACDAAAVG